MDACQRIIGSGLVERMLRWRGEQHEKQAVGHAMSSSWPDLEDPAAAKSTSKADAFVHP